MKKVFWGFGLSVLLMMGCSTQQPEPTQKKGLVLELQDANKQSDVNVHVGQMDFNVK